MKETFRILFPGLGIEEFTMNRIAFSIGKIEIRWYGILITLGIALAFVYAYFRGKRNEGVVFDDIIDIGLCTVTLGVIGARTYYVLTTLDSHTYNSFMDVIAIWNGGIAIYGAIIGGGIGILIGCKWKKIRWQKLVDMAAPGLIIAQALGRWGNFCNGEAYGYAIGSTTRFYFFNTEYILKSGEGTLFHTLRMGLYDTSWSQEPTFYHPTFFYESMWNLLGFVLLHLFYKRKKYDGQIALMYFVWYGFGRMFVEGFRTDSLYIPGTTLRISQCLAVFCVVVGSVALIVLHVLGKERGFAPVFATPVPTKSAAGETVAQAEVEISNEACGVELINENDEETNAELNEEAQIETEERENGNLD